MNKIHNFEITCPVDSINTTVKMDGQNLLGLRKLELKLEGGKSQELVLTFIGNVKINGDFLADQITINKDATQTIAKFEACGYCKTMIEPYISKEEYGFVVICKSCARHTDPHVEEKIAIDAWNRGSLV